MVAPTALSFLATKLGQLKAPAAHETCRGAVP
jgi:hypothetical protein